MSGTDITLGTYNELLPNGMTYTTADALDSSKLVVCYRDSDTNVGAARIGTVSGTDITFGPAATFLGTIPSYVSAAALDSSTFVVCYTDNSDSYHGTAKIGTVSGTAITFGSEAEFLSADGSIFVSVSALGAASFAVAYGDNSDSSAGAMNIGTVSGTDIVFGTRVEFLASSSSQVSAVALSSSSVAVCYSDGTDSGHGTAKAAAIPASGSLSGEYGTAVGAAAEFEPDDIAASTQGIATVKLSATAFCIVWASFDGTYNCYGRIATVSGSDTTLGGESAAFGSGGAEYIAVDALGASAVVAAWKDTGGAGRAAVGTVSGTNITWGAQQTFHFANLHEVGVAALSSGTIVVAYRDSSASNQGTAQVGTVSGADITFGSQQTYEPGYTFSSRVAALDSTRFIVAWRVTDPDGRARIGQVSGTTVTYGAVADFHPGGSPEVLDLAVLGSSSVVVAYRDQSDSDTGKAKAGVTSGLALTWGSAVQYGDGACAFQSASAMDSTHAVIGYVDAGSSNAGEAVVATVSGTSITLGDSVEVFPTLITSVSAVGLSSSSFALSFRDEADGNKGKSRAAAQAADPYPGVAGATRVAFCGWVKKPSA